MEALAYGSGEAVVKGTCNTDLKIVQQWGDRGKPIVGTLKKITIILLHWNTCVKNMFYPIM